MVWTYIIGTRWMIQIRTLAGGRYSNKDMVLKCDSGGRYSCVGWLWDFISSFPVYLTCFPTTFAHLAQGWKDQFTVWCRYVHIFCDLVVESSCWMIFLSFIFLHFLVMIFHFCCNICKIFAEGNFLRRKISYDSEATTVTSLPRDIHGAPAESLVVKLMGMEYCPFKSIVAAVETLDIFVPACCNEYGVLYLLMLIYFDSLQMIIHLGMIIYVEKRKWHKGSEKKRKLHKFTIWSRTRSFRFVGLSTT